MHCGCFCHAHNAVWGTRKICLLLQNFQSFVEMPLNLVVLNSNGRKVAPKVSLLLKIVLDIKGQVTHNVVSPYMQNKYVTFLK